MVDAANPFVFINAVDIGLQGNEVPSTLVPYTSLLMQIRCAAAVAMGLSPDVQTAAGIPGTPKIALLGPPAPFVTGSERSLSEEDMDLHVRPFSMGMPHTSLQMTGAVCLAAACAVPGSIANEIVEAARSRDPVPASSVSNPPLRFAHGSGIIETDSDISVAADGTVTVHSGSVFRTARRLFEGSVYYLAAPEPVLKQTLPSSLFSSPHSASKERDIMVEDIREVVA